MSEIRRRILVTGANGFIARRLVHRLLSPGLPAALQFESLVLLDLNAAGAVEDERVTLRTGSITDPAVLESVFEESFDLIFHLVSIAGGFAEENFDLGLKVNLGATLSLLELCRAQEQPPVVVYSSSIGVYGDLPEIVTDETPAVPNWSYGTHKRMCELAMADYTRKGFVDARVLRFPGIVARPPEPSGALSGFLSDLIRVLAAGKPFQCPISAAAYSWWMSVECCVDNVLYGAGMPSEGLSPQRVWTLPPLRASIAEVVDAIGRVYGTAARKLILYAPQPEIEERFGRLPEARFAKSEAAGFHHDGSADEMVRMALA